MIAERYQLGAVYAGPLRRAVARDLHTRGCNKTSPTFKGRVAYVLQGKRMEVEPMLWYAWVFLVIAILAAVLGFGGIAAGAASIAKVLFFIFLVLFVVSLLTGRRTTV